MRKLHNSHPQILVIGDLMIDHYLWGGCERISPEAPVQVVDIARETTVLGGAGNVINNLVALGAHVSIAGVIGDDENGEELCTMLDAIGVKSEGLVKQKGRKTSKKSRIIASNQQILRYDKESKDAIDLTSEQAIVSYVKSTIGLCDILILSDYGKGVITDTVAAGVITAARNAGKKVLVDPKGKDYRKYQGAYLLTPNKKEASEATGIVINDEESLKKALLNLKETCDLECSMITLSEDGIAIYDESMRRFPTVAKEVYDVTGAGDTVIASLSFALSSGLGIDEAAPFANHAAAVVVGKIGSATVTLSEIEEYESSLHQSTSDMHIKSKEEIVALSDRLKKEGKKVVFTNGCFDILHVGHVKYLQEAKSYGDVLIVGLNSDSSVRELKGPTRPVNNEDDRAYILAALESVDYVVVFSEETPHDLIKSIAPDILVKGGDYEGKVVVGAEFAKELRLVQFVDGKSTTATIARINGGETC
ncbi:MAG: bifunctional heptose 7-phosphate kinase/heptose 1-phosphate adenyltransferase [Sulfuricurvum sp. PD_MW2]|jgi:D-beta-D-heptose 7-phosphate kinase/D-beta-D-heptose 1-phosphate adenosyltransferase|uniref:D-glycero-beta-D-manno-heptose-7-phosphate kinase n=1 Tax=Sulfuricurvum sp. PD_MW2 TaxID=2027917 RepID=UPI000C060FE3|nr:D-glycero-beta-D-manno-heptose-7-phosphate kinase [Sulfuricurvum sp. PD_MW2]PHM17691.1 MAG: bifunctional heptose 7-phosphate kinase/heptose 1-phosphate adenyltransferase [Sulfuricurvum sp. PD_MW2]